MDETSRRLALRLMQQDLDEIRAAQSEEQESNELDDFILALELEALQIINHTQLLDDREYCRRAFPQDEAEQEAAPDAEQDAPSTDVNADTIRNPEGSFPAETAAELAEVSVVEEVASGHLERLESDSHHEHGLADDPRACAACGDMQTESLAVHVSCGHVYCPDCLTSLFDAATTDESLFPLRCCKQPISLDTAREWLPAELIAKFEEKRIEFTTPNRTYCCNIQCSEFIPPAEIASDIGFCQTCKESTCTVCKNAAHDGLCPEDPSATELLSVAKENGWQQCFGCKNLVELNHGCNHITCRCGCEFCYVCGGKWRSCHCDQWDEERLMERAEQLIGRGMFGGRNNAAAVREAQRHIQETHECTHRRWRYRPGGGPCEHCRKRLPHYLFDCTGCHITVCNTCKNNRL